MIAHSSHLVIRSRTAVTFDLDARLPGQVFKRDAGDSLFCEFDAVLTPEFWPVLRAMARWHGDRRVELLVLEPDRDALYFPEYRMCPAIGHEPDGDVMGSIAISANVVAVTGLSGKWGCWGERDPEVAVFQGFPDLAARNEWCAQFGPFLDVSGALESYLPLTFAGRSVPDEYAATLAANYGPPGGSRP
ncbi:hypothetical protein ACFY1P_10490 [Streptomyces sp. NPDC001407]|uniref:hypothetical protein n=1 Tax=Streptomyces sp. NPDC001407 TaxID=3364573 RepID=UPI0036A9564C